MGGDKEGERGRERKREKKKEREGGREKEKERERGGGGRERGLGREETGKVQRWIFGCNNNFFFRFMGCCTLVPNHDKIKTWKVLLFPHLLTAQTVSAKGLILCQ